MSVDLDTDLERLRPIGMSQTTTLLTEREDQATIRKVSGLEIPAIPDSLEGVSLKDRVSIDETAEQLKSVSSEELELAVKTNPDLGPNYIIRLQNLVASLLAQFQQISEKDKVKIDQLEKEYKLTTLSVADLQKELGWSNLKFAAVSFGASFLQFLSPHESDRTVAKLFAEQVCPRFGELWKSGLDARLTTGSNMCQMLMNKYNMLSQTEQSKANDKQQISAMFDKALRSLESAARAG